MINNTKIMLNILNNHHIILIMIKIENHTNCNLI